MTVALNVGKILFIIVSMFLTGCKSDNNLVQETKIDNVKIELTFMAYSCGDCVDLYRIDKVISSESNEKKFFLNKEIEVEFLQSETKSFIEDTKCPLNCYKFECEGEIFRKSNGMICLKSKKTNLKSIRNCCTLN